MKTIEVRDLVEDVVGSLREIAREIHKRQEIDDTIAHATGRLESLLGRNVARSLVSSIVTERVQCTACGEPRFVGEVSDGVCEACRNDAVEDLPQ